MKDENKQKENRIALFMKETEKFRGSNKKKVTTLQAEINELKESISDNFVDVNSDNKTNSNIKQVNNNNNS